MKNKHIVIVSLILLTILTMGAASASDLDDGLAVDDSGDDLSVSSVDSYVIYENSGDLVADDSSDLISSDNPKEIDSKSISKNYLSDGNETIYINDTGYGNGSYFDNETSLDNGTDFGNGTDLNGTDFGNGTDLNVTVLESILNVSASNIVYGEIGEINIILTDSNGNLINGTIDVFLNDREVSYDIEGMDILSLANLPAGEYNCTVIFNGSAYYSYSSASTSFVVSKAQSLLSVSVEDIFYGEVAVVSVSVTDLNSNPVSGMVILALPDCNATVGVVDGFGSYSASGLDVGNYSVMAIFLGGENYLGSSNSTVFAVIENDVGNETNVTVLDSVIAVSAEDIVYGEDCIIVISLTDVNGSPIDGTVEFVLDGNAYVLDIADGVGQLVLSDLNAGAYALNAIYSGDENYASSSVSNVIIVQRVDTILDLSVDVDDGITVIVHLFDINENPVSGNLELYFDDCAYTVETDEEGLAYLELEELEPGEYVLVANYPGDDNHLNTNMSVTFEIEDDDEGDDDEGDEDETIVTPENFFDFFDENGLMTTEARFLVFEGEFSASELYISSITINDDVRIEGRDAVLNDTRIIIGEGVDCEINDLVLNYAGDGDLIYVGGASSFVFKNNLIDYSSSSNLSCAVNITNCDFVDVIGNSIDIYGQSYVYGINIDSMDFYIYSNAITVDSEYYASAISINGPSLGDVMSNNINVRAEKMAYSINTNPEGGLQVRYIDNEIWARSYFAVGIYDDSEEIRNNNIELEANYAYGIVVLSGGTLVKGNQVTLDTTNEGDDDDVSDAELEIGTAGIVVKTDSEDLVTITGNDVDSNDQSVSLLSGSSEITDNKLNGYVNVESEGNTISNNKIFTDEEYAIVISSSGNEISNNKLVADGNEGDDAVNDENGENDIGDNRGRQILTEGDVTIEIVEDEFYYMNDEEAIVMLTLPEDYEGCIVITGPGVGDLFEKELDDIEYEYEYDDGFITYYIYPADLDYYPNIYEITVRFFNVDGDVDVEFTGSMYLYDDYQVYDEDAVTIEIFGYLVNAHSDEDTIVQVTVPSEYEGAISIMLYDDYDEYTILDWAVDEFENYFEDDGYISYIILPADLDLFPGYYEISVRYFDADNDYEVRFDGFIQLDEDDQYYYDEDADVGIKIYDVAFYDSDDEIVIVTVPSDYEGVISIFVWDEEEAIFSANLEDLDKFDDEGYADYFIYASNLDLSPRYYDIEVLFENDLYEVRFSGIIELYEDEWDFDGDFGYDIYDFVSLNDEDALFIWHNGNIDEGRIEITVDDNDPVTRDLDEDYDDRWTIDDLGIAENGIYTISAKYVSNDEEQIIFEDKKLYVSDIQVRAGDWSVYVDDPLFVLAIYGAGDDTSISVDGSDSVSGQRLPNRGPLVWYLSDLGISSTGEYDLTLHLYDEDGNLFADYPCALDVIGIGEEYYRLVHNIDWDYFTSSTPVAALYCPEGSEGAINIEIYYADEDDDEYLDYELLYVIDDEISASDIDDFKIWTLADLGINEPGWHYGVVIKDSDDEIIFEFEFGAMLYHAIDIFIDGEAGLNYDWLVNINSPLDNDGEVILMIGDEVYFNDTLQNLQKYQSEEDIANYQVHFHFGPVNFNKTIEAGEYGVIVYYNGYDGYKTDSTKNDNPDTIFIYSEVYRRANLELTVGDDPSIITAKLTDSHGAALSGVIYVSVNGGEDVEYAVDDEGIAIIEFDGNASVVAYYKNSEDDWSYDEIKVYVFNVPEEIIISPNANICLEKVDDTVVITLTDLEGSPISNADILVIVNGEASNATTDASGKYAVDVSANATVVVSFTDVNGIAVSSSIVTVENNNTVEVEKIVEVNNTVEVPVEVEKIVEVNNTVEVPVEVEKIVEVNNTVEVPVYVLPNATIALASEDGSSVIATLTDLDGNAISNADITVSVNGHESSAKTDANGAYSIEISGNSTVVVSYVDSNNITTTGYLNLIIINTVTEKIVEINNTIEINNTVEVPLKRTVTSLDYNDMTTKALTYPALKTGEFFVYTLKDDKGNVLAGKNVSVGFNGHVYTYITDENGQAKTQVNLKVAGGYTFAVCFLGDEEYNASFVAAKITVEKQKPSLTVPAKTYKASAKTKTLTATFKDEKGQLIKGKSITFTVNGKTYTATTNAKGVASVKVSLSTKKTYSFTAKFDGDDTFAAVTKTGKLTIK